MTPSWVVSGSVALILVVCVSWTAGEVELNPSAPNVCFRSVRETKWVFTNTSMPCWRTEYTPPPCEGDYWRSWHHGERRHHHSGRRRHRGKRQATTWNPFSTTTRQFFPFFTTTTTTSPSSSLTSTTPTVDTGERCCRRVLDTCWFMRERCIWVYTEKHFCCPGYEPDGIGGCKLQIECAQDNGGCDQICHHDDTNGHFCSCFTGYNLVDDRTCEDVDECAVNNGGCSQECVNLAGSYYCSCKSGYILTSPHQCIEIDECAINNGGCDHECVNTDGSHYCKCEEGFDLVDGAMCADEDECSVGNGGCSHICTNDYGGFSCECPEGMDLEPEGFKCIMEPTGPVVGDPNALPVESLGKIMSDPITYGSIIGGLILLILIILLAVFARRLCCRRGSAAPEAASVFVVGKKKTKKMLDLESDLGKKPPIGYDAESINFDMFDGDESDEKKGNIYTSPPSLISYGSDGPPPYSKDPISYENDDAVSSKSYEKPKIMESDNKSQGYTNIGYQDDISASNLAQDAEQVYDDVEIPAQRPYDEVINNLRNTQRLNSQKD